jgi:DNA-binding Lrp family transcriptional regulator
VFGGLNLFLKGLDEIDRRILDLLSENARMSYVNIGMKVNLSRVAVKTRIRSLENQGIIEKYVTIINPTKLSHTISVFFDIELEPSSVSQVIDILRNDDVFTQVYQVTGPSKLHAHAIVSTDEGLSDLLNNVIYKLPGLKKVKCDTILTRIKDIKGVRL